MTMVAYAAQVHEISKSENPRTVSVDFTSSLDQGDTLTGTPVVTPSPALPTSQEQVNTSALRINRVTVEPGHAVQFRVDPSAADVGDYQISAQCLTVTGDYPEGRICLKVVE